MIEPTPGRVVWYRPNSIDAPKFGMSHNLQPLTLAAIVAYVYDNRLVNLMVVDPFGNSHSRTSVRLLQDDDVPNPTESYCEWMPYQKGQAAKHGI